MAQAIFGEKRTRSQLTLPDELLLHLPQRSPMKDARLARRHLAQEASSPPSTSEVQEQFMSSSFQGAESESRPKRSISPVPEPGTLGRHSEPPPERGAKRAKREPNFFESHGSTHRKKVTATRRGLHTRLASDPSVNQTRRSMRKGSTVRVEQVQPASSTSSPIFLGSDQQKMNQRAKSVPLFPSSSSLPFIDFKNPPPSPRRARSRSPEKEEPKLKIKFLHSKLDIPVEEATAEMEIEEDGSTDGMEEAKKPTEQVTAIPQHEVQVEVEPAKAIQLVTTALPALQTNTSDQLPNTPAASRLLSSPISPLTPLPETPFPAELENAGGHMVKSVHHDEPSRSEDAGKPELVSPSEHLRFKSPANLPQSIEPLSLYPISSCSSSRRRASSTRNNALTVLGRKSSSSADSNVFSIMMQANQAKKNPPLKSGHAKGKQRADLDPSRSSAALSTVDTLANGIWKNERPGTAGSKNKLKARMRTRERPKVEAVPNLTVPEEAEADDETALEQTGATCGIRDPLPSSLPTESPPAVRGPPVGNHVTFSREDAGRAEMDQSIAPSVASSDCPTFHFAPEWPIFESTMEVSPNADALAVDGIGDCPKTVLPGGEPNVATQHASEGEWTEMICDQSDLIHDSTSIQQTGNLESEAAANPVVPTTDIATKNNKSRLPRRKVAATIVPVNRLTRSTSSKMKSQEHVPSTSVVQSPPASSHATRPRVTSSLASKPGRAKTPSPTRNEPRNPMDLTGPPRTPNRPSTPGRKPTGSNYAKPTTSSAAKGTKTPSRPPRSSPAKLNHASFMQGPSRQSTMLSGDIWNSGAPSSLSTLSIALEKLRKPPPSRPNTSLGFNRAADDSNLPVDATRGTSDEGKGQPLSRAKVRKRSSSFDIPSSSGITLKSQPPMQQPISLFFASKQGAASTSTNGPSSSGTKPAMRRKMFGIASGGVFAMGMRNRAPKVSRKTCLPTVAGSPVKGGELVNDDNEPVIDNGDDKDRSLEIVMDSAPDMASLDSDEYFVPIGGDSSKDTKDTGKKEDSGLWENSSRRASLASLALSETLSSLPSKGPMGPPPTIPRHGRVTRSTSNSYISASQTNSPPDESGRIMIDAVSKAQSKGSPRSSLGFMKDCVVFVDIRTDDGDDAGSLFVEMLESAGAKVLSRVGQTCTHIVFKNGLLSTMSRYRLLRDPKPFVVGIAWIVECVEQRKQVDETKFLVDLDEMNSIGATKRRKSLLPKLASLDFDDTNAHNGDYKHEEDGNQSVDGSNSSLTLDDLPPLEKARRRKSFLVGPRP